VEVADLPIARTNCKIVLIDTLQAVEKAVSDLYLSDIVGFDTETKPSFTSGKINKVALLQLSSAKKCYLFRLQMLGQTQLLREFLESEKILKIGLSIADDFKMLNKWMNIKPNNFIELQTFVKEFGIQEMSLQKIFAIAFAKKISKKQQLSNWEATTLNDAQKVYAATDAWACRQIYLELIKPKQ
jgi:ribonuclease D